MIHIIADSNIPFLQGALEDVARVSYFPAAKITRKQLINADALIIRTRTNCNEQLLAGTQVKFIATATIGHDHIDADYCKMAGIRWSNAPGCNAGSVMQYVASALAHIVKHDQKRFTDYSIGVIGAGHVGSKVAHLAAALGMRVLINDPPRSRAEGTKGFTELDELLHRADIVSMHMPLQYAGPDISYHMADDSFFSRMKSSAWFINTARGEVMHTKALKNALRTGKLGGAVIDVWENEPDIDKELLRAVSIGTPHIAGYSLDGKANGTAASVQAVSRFFKLSLDNWYPPQIPKPAQPVITPKSANQSTEVLVCDAFMHAYNIVSDSDKLKANPKGFERFRDEYPPRREFHAYRLNLQGLNSQEIQLFEKLVSCQCCCVG